MHYAPTILPPSSLFLKLEPSKEQRRYPGYWTHPRCLPNPTEGFQLGVRTNGITSSCRKAMSSYQLSIYASVSVTCLFFSPTLGSSCYLLEFGFQGPCLIFASSTEEVPDNALTSPSSREPIPWPRRTKLAGTWKHRGSQSSVLHYSTGVSGQRWGHNQEKLKG